MKKLTQFILLFSFLFSSQLFSQVQWQWQMPQPTGNILYDVKMLNENTGYTCGAAGNILKTTNGGLNWVMLNTGFNKRLWAMSIIDSINLIAVSDSGLYIKSSNSGLNWSLHSIASSSSIFNIEFINHLTGIICGSNSLIMKTTDKGNTWFTLNSDIFSSFFEIAFIDLNTGFIGGNRTLIKTTNSGLNWFSIPITFTQPFSQIRGLNTIGSNVVCGMIVLDEKIIYSTNQGVDWSYYNITFPTLDGSNDILRKMKFINPSTGYLTTDFGRICKTTNGGVNWSVDSTFKFNFYRIGVLWDVEVINNSVLVTGGGGTIIRSTNSGQNYSLIQGWKHQLNDIKFINQQTGFVVGERGDIFKSTNQGTTWDKINSNTINNLTSVDFLNSQTGFISGDTGTILKTTNQGLNWNKITIPFNRLINKIHFKNFSTGYFTSSYTIYKTTNSGDNWFRTDSNFNEIFTDIYFLNNDTGFVSAGTEIFRTFNDGVNWISSGTVLSNSISFINNSTGFTGSGNRVYKTTNTGISWTGIHTGGLGIKSVYFGSDQKGMACALDGYIVRTTNSGVNWERVYLTNNTMFKISFLNQETGFIIGDWGNIIKTTNGGLTFTETNVTETIDNFELKQNYPNPFNPETTIPFTVNKNNSDVKLQIYDINGKLISTLINKIYQSGSYETKFIGNNLSTGVYFYKLSINNISQTKRMILMK